MAAEKGRARSSEPGLFDTTRGKVLVLLCRGPRTVSELGAELGVTNNAIRAQLRRLGRQGLSRQAGSRRGVRRPHAEYELSDRGRRLFPRAYEPLLRALVDVLAERFPDRVARDLLLRAGRRLVADHVGDLTGATPRQRLAEVLTRLNESAAGVELTEQDGRASVRACSCP